MKLKLALLHEVMSKDEALLCLLRGLASRPVRLTLWSPETANKGALAILFFSAWSFPCLRLDSRSFYSQSDYCQAAKSHLVDCAN